MTSLRMWVVVVGLAGCIIAVALFVHVDSRRAGSRLAFDNHGYPPSIGVELWLDDATEGKLMRATCTIDRCETEPMFIDKGRHQVRLRVVVNDQASAFTATTIER